MDGREIGTELVRHESRGSLTGSLMVLVVVVLGGSACGIKRTVKVQVSSRILQAKTASFQELVALADGYADRIQSLSSTTMRVTFRSGKIESGKLQEYRSAPGMVILRRPDSIRLRIQNPLTKLSIADLVSSGSDFSLWSPTENKFFEGKNSIKEFEVEGSASSPSFTARPIDIFHSILWPKLPLGEPGYRLAKEEDQDTTAKYYVLALYKDDEDGRLAPVRKLWIERAELAVARQQTYGSHGELAGIVHYSNLSSMEGIVLPLSIRLEQPVDGYSLELEFRSWRVNPQLPDDAFMLTPPPGAQRIHLREKGKSKES